MATHARALRVGVLLGNQLVEERVFSGAAPVTFGQSLRCLLSIPADGVPLEHVLFARGADGAWELRPTPAMQVARAERRGRIRLGEVTILYQEIAAVAAAPRPQLPASVRGTLADRIDRRLAVIVGASVVVHIGIAAWAWSTDRDTDLSMLSPHLQQYEQETIDITVPDEPVLLPPQPSEPAPGVAAPAVPSRQVPRALPTAPDPTRLAPTRDQTAEALRFAAVLSSSDPGQDEIATGGRRRPGADLKDEIDDVRDHHLAVGQGSHTSRDEQPRLDPQPPRDPHIGDPRLVQLEHRPDEPRGRVVIRPQPGPTSHTTLTAEMVLAKINGAYSAGLQRCYQKGLLHDGTLSGRVPVAFTVTDTGRVEDAEASGSTDEVDSCIQAQMGSWRFPIPRNSKGEPTDQEFRLVLALQQS